MSSTSRQTRSSIKKVDKPGIAGELGTTSIASDVKLFACNKAIKDQPVLTSTMTVQEARQPLSNTANDSMKGAPSPTSPFVDLNELIPLVHKEDDIIPNLSPVSWLSSDSWSSMSYYERLGFMEHLMNGNFRR